MKFATVFEGKVQNLIEANSKEIAEQVTGLTCIEYTEENPAVIGWTYDGAEFTAPVVEDN
jgi:hypothetical protein